MSFSQYLHQILAVQPLDFSALYISSGWFMDHLRGREIGSVEASASALSEALSLSSGHGISEIWQVLYHAQSPGICAKIISMDQAVKKSSPGAKL